MLDKGFNFLEFFVMYLIDKELMVCMMCELENYDVGVKRFKEKMNWIGMNNYVVVESFG